MSSQTTTWREVLKQHGFSPEAIAAIYREAKTEAANDKTNAGSALSKCNIRQRKALEKIITLAEGALDR